MKKTWLGLLMPVLFCACSEQNVGGEFFLRGQEVKIASANENLWPVFMSGDAMFANAENGGCYFGKIIKNEWQKAEGLPKNDGQDDWEIVHFAQGYNGELILLNQPMFGMVINSLVKIPNADNAVAILDQKKRERYDLKQLQGVRDVARSGAAISDTTILTAISYTDDIKRLFSILDFKNQKAIPLDYWPEDESPNDTARWYNHVAGCTILGNGKGKFLYQNRFAKLAYIFSVDGTKVNKLCDMYSYRFTPKRPTECLSCCANSERIYMLQRDSNIKGEKFKEDSDMFGNIIEVFNWDGVKQQVIHLDNYYQQIMLSGDGNTLFLLPGMTDEIIKPAIYSYDISNLEDNPMIDSIEIEKICKANIEKTIKKYGKKDFLKEGDMMVDFEMYDYNDKPHHLNEFLGKDKYTILVFNDLYCGWCQKAKPYLEKFYKQNKGKFEMITVSTDKLSEWKKKPFGEVSWHDWNDHNCAIDIRNKYDAQGTPTFFVLTPEGKIVKKHAGFSEQIFDEMKDIVSGKE